MWSHASPERTTQQRLFEYLEIFHNWQRRHSSIGMLSPIEYERRHAETAARDQAS